MVFMFCWKMISLHYIFYLYVILTCHIIIYNVSHILVWWQKWDISLSIYLHNSESFDIMWIFSSHCITIFIYYVHELTGSMRLSWTDRINIASTSCTQLSLLLLFYQVILYTSRESRIKHVSWCLMFPLKIMYLDNIFYLYVKVTCHIIIYHESCILAW